MEQQMVQLASPLEILRWNLRKDCAAKDAVLELELCIKGLNQVTESDKPVLNSIWGST